MSDPEIVESFLANQRMGEHKDDDLEKDNMILKTPLPKSSFLSHCRPLLFVFVLFHNPVTHCRIDFNYIECKNIDVLGIQTRGKAWQIH